MNLLGSHIKSGHKSYWGFIWEVLKTWTSKWIKPNKFFNNLEIEVEITLFFELEDFKWIEITHYDVLFFVEFELHTDMMGIFRYINYCSVYFLLKFYGFFLPFHELVKFSCFCVICCPYFRICVEKCECFYVIIDLLC